MAETTGIGWTDSTFNCWRGCTRVSEACRYCYAETLSKRNPQTLGVWGPSGTRVVASESKWREPLRWNWMTTPGKPHRVFCASLADVFEDWRGPMMDASGNRLHLGEGLVGGTVRSRHWYSESPCDETPGPWLTMGDVRRRLFDLICRTPSLTWQLLTKRPENALRMMVDAGLYAVPNPSLPCPQPNLWIGTTVEDQGTANERIPHLLATPAAVRFLSCEPLLGPVDLSKLPYPAVVKGNIGWVIVGCESGGHRRPMQEEWAESLVEQCAEVGVRCFVKQMDVGGRVSDDAEVFPLRLRVREFPTGGKA